MQHPITPEQEQKIITLASEIAKNIVPVDELLQQLGITEEEWGLISRTKVFNDVLRSSSQEWNAASNTYKRSKLKAAAVIESVLPEFYHSMVDKEEKLSDRAKVLETVAKIAGLNVPDPVAAPTGNVFRLQINYSGDNSSSITLGVNDIPDLDTLPSDTQTVNISSLFANEDPEDL